MAKQKKKRKHKHSSNPPLSFADKVIYTVLGLILAGIVAGIYFAFIAIIEKIAFSDGSVVAYYSRRTIFFVSPFFLFLIVSIAVFFDSNSSRPIIKNKKINYNNAKWNKVRFIFDKPIYSEKEKEKRRKDAIKYSAVWFSILFLTILISFLSYCGRFVLKENFKIEKYTVFNDISETYTLPEYEKVEFRLYYSPGVRYSPSSYRLYVYLYTKNDKEIMFSYEDFKSDKPTEILTTMLEIKSRFSENEISYYTDCDFDDAADYFNFNDSETDLLKTLFN